MRFFQYSHFELRIFLSFIFIVLIIVILGLIMSNLDFLTQKMIHDVGDLVKLYNTDDIKRPAVEPASKVIKFSGINTKMEIQCAKNSMPVYSYISSNLRDPNASGIEMLLGVILPCDTNIHPAESSITGLFYKNSPIDTVSVASLDQRNGETYISKVQILNNAYVIHIRTYGDIMGIVIGCCEHVKITFQSYNDGRSETTYNFSTGMGQ